MTVAEALEKSLARLQKGWCKHTYLDDDDNVCSMGAVYLAVDGIILSSDPTGVVQECRQALTNVMDGKSVGTFNDSHTQAEVEAKFREAIEKQKAMV